jgi:hypothetical protein
MHMRPRRRQVCSRRPLCCALIEIMGRSAGAEAGQVGGACKCQSVAS